MFQLPSKYKILAHLFNRTRSLKHSKFFIKSLVGFVFGIRIWICKAFWYGSESKTHCTYYSVFFLYPSLYLYHNNIALTHFPSRLLLNYMLCLCSVCGPRYGDPAATRPLPTRLHLRSRRLWGTNTFNIIFLFARLLTGKTSIQGCESDPLLTRSDFVEEKDCPYPTFLRKNTVSKFLPEN